VQELREPVSHPYFRADETMRMIECGLLSSNYNPCL
jgi:hypothetical protein